MRRFLGHAGAISLLACACREAPAHRARVSLRDSAGVEIVESVPPAWSAVAAWVIDTLPTLDIGDDVADPNQEFTAPSRPIRFGDGRIAVSDHGSQQIRFFDVSGRWIRSVGQRGRGPEEFTDLRVLVRGPGDSLFAYEPHSNVLSVLDSAGRFVRRARPELTAPGRSTTFAGVFDDGRWLVEAREFIRPTTGGVYRGTITLYEYSAEGERGDSLTTIPGVESFAEPVADQGYRSLLLPLGRGALTTVHGARAYFGVTERVDLRVYRRGVGLERIVRISLPERPITREVIDRTVDDWTANWRTDEREQLGGKLRGATYPDNVPALSDLLVADHGELWFREHEMEPDAASRFVVTDSTGRWVAWVVGPTRFWPSWIGEDLVLGLWYDPDGVAHVRAYRLSRIEPE